MHVLMFLGGLIALAAGSTALGLGVLDHGGGSAGALIMPGAIGVIGGLALLGVGTIITRLAGIADILERQPVPRAIAEPAQQDIAMRSAVLAAERSGAPTITAEHMPPQPRIAPSVNPPVALSEPPRQPHAAPPVEPPVSVPSPASNATASAPPIPPPTHLTPHSAVAAALLDTPPPMPPPPPSPAADDGKPRVLKSGVIEGMAYTLYSDGAVDAELPRIGIVRFASIAEWRAYMRAET